MRYISPWWWLLLGLALLLICWPANAQTLPTSENSQPSIEDSLSNLQSNLKRLKTLLEERRIALEQAKSQLSELRSELANLQIRLSESQLATQRLTASLELSRLMLSDLETTFEEYQMEAEDAIMRARILWGAVGAFAGFVLGLVLFI